MQIETKRLLLRPFQARDADDMLAYALEEAFWRLLPAAPRHAAGILEFVANRAAAAQPDEAGNYYLAAWEKEAGRTIGTFRLRHGDRIHRQGDIGWALDPARWGHGLALEGAEAMLEFGFHGLGLERIWANADLKNERSWRLMERLGMTREGILRHHRLVEGEFRDNVLYAILAAEYNARHLTRAAHASRLVA